MLKERKLACEGMSTFHILWGPCWVECDKDTTTSNLTESQK